MGNHNKSYRKKKFEHRDKYVYKENLVQKPIVARRDCLLKNRTDVDFFIKYHTEWQNSRDIHIFEEKSKTIKDKALRLYYESKIRELRQEIYDFEQNKPDVTSSAKTPWRRPVHLSNEKLREMGIHGQKYISTPMGGQDRKYRH